MDKAAYFTPVAEDLRTKVAIALDDLQRAAGPRWGELSDELARIKTAADAFVALADHTDRRIADVRDELLVNAGASSPAGGTH